VIVKMFVGAMVQVVSMSYAGGSEEKRESAGNVVTAWTQ